jgi:hypothetical protein
VHGRGPGDPKGKQARGAAHKAAPPALSSRVAEISGQIAPKMQQSGSGI